MGRGAVGGWLIALSLAAVTTAATAADEEPSLELLLHLAEFSDADGRPVDPESVAETMEAIDPRASGDAKSPAASAARPGGDRKRDRSKPRREAAPPQGSVDEPD